jgi:3-hexulose-6-phosphate synthase
MKLQVSVDLISLEQAMNLLKDVAPYVDIIEAGTPLIKQEGLQVVKVFKQTYPDKLIFADLKTMDAGELEAELAFQAGADITTVLAVANNATITGAIAAAQKYGKTVTADMIGVQNRLQRAMELKQLGIQSLEMHWGLDEQSQHHWDFSELQSIRDTVGIPFAVAGGINATTINQVQMTGADVVAVGGAIYSAASPGTMAKELREKISAA